MLKSLCALGLVLATFPVGAATTVFTDGDFVSTWNTVMPTNGLTTNPDSGGGGSQTTTVSLSGGNPDSFLDIRLNVGSNNRIVGTFSWREDFTINPAAVGGITNISYSFDAKRGASTNAGNAQAFGIAIRQNGIHYYNYNANSLTTWNTYSDTNLTNAELAVYGGESDEASAGGFETPDFSASGAPITFGYMRLNSTVGSNVFVHGFMDNYSVTVEHNLVPEPTLSVLVLMGAAAFTARRRR